MKIKYGVPGTGARNRCHWTKNHKSILLSTIVKKIGEYKMFQKKSADGYKPAIDKIEMKTLVHGNKTLMVEFRMETGALLPRHSHPHEQTGYLISGSINLTINKQTFTVKPGDSWCIDGDIEHSAEILEDTVAVEVFSPVRDDYLP